MKMPFQIITAAAAVVSAMVRQMVVRPYWPEADQATVLPPITPKLVEQLAFAGGTDAEIADRFLIEESELREQFRDVLRRARGTRRLNLRGYQSDLAKKLNGPMLIWLGRNELNQSLNPASPGEPMPEIPEE